MCIAFSSFWELDY
uniref:Uncharacterized protein n=1 Tax=Rhizophora mucronata TaxID=61149 RepID=A0A2P2NBJ7_RHIMU